MSNAMDGGGPATGLQQNEQISTIPKQTNPPDKITKAIKVPEAQVSNNTKKAETKDVASSPPKSVQKTATVASEMVPKTAEENQKSQTVASGDNKSTTANTPPLTTDIKQTTDKQESTENRSNKSTVNSSKPIKEKGKQENNVNGNEEEEEEDVPVINIQELTEQIMNMLNDGKSDDEVLTTQELLKKNVELQEFILKLIQVLKEKTNLCVNLERQNTALIGQAQSLKDVISITKDLLGIRNMEVEHLHADMSSMENSIKEERLRHNTAVAKLNEAMTLNDKLKHEYLVQMDLFQKLREKYNEKVVVLTKENQRLNELVKCNNDLANAEMQEAGPACKSEEVLHEEVSEESVDK